MFQKIVLATDGSDNAQRAAQAAIDLAKGLSLSSIMITHIITNPPDQSRMVKAQFDVHTLLEDDAKAALQRTIDVLSLAGLSYDLKVAIGDPSVEIVDIAKKEMADLIIIGSRGLGTLQGILLGSVSQKIAQAASCPVMIVK
ncbi:MAG: universal stress protein [Methanomicrobiales archaeon HGW-Methanomicrobiales-4]|nr:MAG: universal stress protein [Methanomicrobiales archaeon HGW-Methanomicrobiales-4]